MKSIQVVAAIICDESGRVFATQRGYGEWKDWWEFPGGKIEAGETAEEALHREIREELLTEIVILRLFKTIDYQYPDFNITLHCFLCRLADNRLTLKEHEDARWLTRDELTSVRWLPADNAVISALKEVPEN